MRLLITFARTYTLQSIIVLLALLLAGVAEGFGLSAMIPLFASIADKNGGAGQNASGLTHLVTESLSFLGLSPSIGVLLVFIVITVMLKGALMLLANKRVGYTVAYIATDLRLALLRSLLTTRWEYYLSQPVGGLSNSFATEAMRASQAYLFGARMMAFLIQVIIYTSVALLVSWEATLVSMAAGVVMLYGMTRLIRKARKSGGRQTDLLQSSLEVLTDSLQSIKPLKAMAREDLIDVALGTETKRLNKALQKQVFSKEALRSLREPIIVSFLAFGLCVAVVYCGIPFASVMVLVFLLSRLLTQLGKVQEQYQSMIIFESAYWSLQDKINAAEKERESMPGRRSPSLKQGIRLDHVGFKYGESWVLKNASLELPAGRFTAITGLSGVGKTTVADLIIGLLLPQEGRILIDDIPLMALDIRSWRQMIGYVPQETLLLHDTIMKNVTLGDPELNERDAKGALRAAGILDFVMSMPQGLESTVGERGGKLSGGQRQRIAIARALVHNPSVLILDEATSGLDAETEASICDTLRGLTDKLTILAISHQPALVNAADMAYRIENNTIRLIENHDKMADVCNGE
ncbi:MAG: ABC transporter ATP-binding protein [Dissulfuribacterales bacterium]